MMPFARFIRPYIRLSYRPKSLLPKPHGIGTGAFLPDGAQEAPDGAGYEEVAQGEAEEGRHGPAIGAHSAVAQDDRFERPRYQERPPDERTVGHGDTVAHRMEWE